MILPESGFFFGGMIKIILELDITNFDSVVVENMGLGKLSLIHFLIL